MRSHDDSNERIELLRGGSVVSTLLGSFGLSIRETRLTAALGYLIALDTKPFLASFGIPGVASSVRLENRHGVDRSDILIETTKGTVVVEAKVGSADPLIQARKYGARWTVLLTDYEPAGAKPKGVTYVRWCDLAPILRQLTKHRRPDVRWLAADFVKYMEDHGMIRQNESAEIYARDINEPVSLALFLKGHLYGCWYKEGSRLPEARYFAPHLGQFVAWAQPGIHAGISYVAKIEQIETVLYWSDLTDAITRVRGKAWWNANQEVVKPIHRKWEWDGKKKRNFLFLGQPRMVFNPPIEKTHLQAGRGYLSKLFYSFDDLFEAWGC